MRDTEIRRVLTRLESLETAPAGAAVRAKSKMLDEYDTFTEPVFQPQEPAAEISLLVAPERDGRSSKRYRVWIPVAAAAIVAALFMVRTNLPDRYDPSEVVAADSITDESAMPIDETDQGLPDTRPNFVDDDLPRLIDGEFTTSALGDTMSFIAEEPVWLTRHQAGLVELSRDVDDPLAAALVIARVEGPAAALNSESAIDYLSGQPPGVTGQVTAHVIDGVSSMFWHGRFDPLAAGLNDCLPGDVCLTLFDTPIPIGLEPGVTNHLVERPTADGDTYILIASIPYDQFGSRPFEAAFDELAATIDFSDE